MEDMFMQVQCPCCLSDKNDIKDSLLLLGDDDYSRKIRQVKGVKYINCGRYPS